MRAIEELPSLATSEDDIRTEFIGTVGEFIELVLDERGNSLEPPMVRIQRELPAWVIGSTFAQLAELHSVTDMAARYLSGLVTNATDPADYIARRLINAVAAIDGKGGL